MASALKAVSRSSSEGGGGGGRLGADGRDEYGHLTFGAQCAALKNEGVDPGWPLHPPSADSSNGIPTL
jgi:hypothetical protein